MIKTILRSACVFMAVAFFAAPAGAEAPAKPAASDKCPVCGMFVAPYPHWTAAIVFRDGATAYFDGPKDMLKYWFHVSRYDKARRREDIVGVYVTEYYRTVLMKADEVFFIKGSDVRGPMGEEMVPVAGEENAQTFIKDHGGAKPLRFGEITSDDIP